MLEFLKCVDKRTLRKLIFLVLTVLWCMAIFHLSSETGDESSDTSGGIINVICEIAVPDFSAIDTAERDSMVESLQFAVRKCAHFTAYLILSVLSVQFFAAFERLKKPLAAGGAALLFCAIYASSDEIHQSFVPDRSPQVRDVLIDTCGALCGLLITYAVYRAIRHFKT
jgi:hypothetical protein